MRRKVQLVETISKQTVILGGKGWITLTRRELWELYNLLLVEFACNTDK